MADENKSVLGRKLLLFTVCFALAALLFYWVTAEDWSRTVIDTDMINASGLIPLGDEDQLSISQGFLAEMNELNYVKIQPGKVRTETEGSVTFRILEDRQVLWENETDSGSLQSGEINRIAVEPAVKGKKGKHLVLQIEASNTGLSFQQGNTISSGKFDVAVQSEEELTVNGVRQEGSLVAGFQGIDRLTAYRWIFPGAGVIYLLILTLVMMAERQRRTGKANPVGTMAEQIHRYSYLLKTLVARDFRIKYQSSLLGALWSFLNPLLTMLVYLFVFSTIFRGNIEYFPVYLLSGIVLFNYFSESTSLGLLSIVGNRSLITKVYMPKYIYPLAKVLSSAINLIISFIPLFIVILLSGLPIHKSILLLPLVVLFLVVFCTGISLILSTLNVYFRDIQFLWGILITILNFLTPIFYPESIIPQRFVSVYHLNPLYQIVYFMRCIIIGGVSPTPITYLYCLLACLVPLAIGILFFRKNQDRIVLYL